GGVPAVFEGGAGPPAATSNSVKHRNHRPVVARAELALHDARRCSSGEPFTGHHVVESAADVALFEVGPGRPPREEVGGGGIQLTVHIDEAMAEDLLDERAFIGALTDDSRFSLLRMHVHLRSSDVHVSAHDKR